MSSWPLSEIFNKPATLSLACEQALRSAQTAGWEKEGELATMSLEFEFHAPPIPLWLCQLSYQISPNNQG